MAGKVKRGRISMGPPAGRPARQPAKSSALYNPDSPGWGALASAWHTPAPAKKSAPKAPSAPAAISPAEAARRRKILAAPLAKPRTMRAEDGIGVFSADPRVRDRAAAALNAQTPTPKAVANAGKRSPLPNAHPGRHTRRDPLTGRFIPW